MTRHSWHLARAMSDISKAAWEARRLLRVNQRELGELLGLSSRTIQRWDKSGSFQPYFMPELARAVHPQDPALAARIAALVGRTLEDLGIAPGPAPAPALPAPPPPHPGSVSFSPELKAHLVDAVVCAAADALSLPPASVRPALLAAFRKAAEVKLTIADVLAVLAPPPTPLAQRRGA
jgi:hypothetical protein